MSERLRYVLKPLAIRAYLYCGCVQVRNVFFNLAENSRVTVLAYHRIAVSRNDVNAVSPSVFDKQMAYLKDHYDVINMSDFMGILADRKCLRRAVVVTFDDGYRDNFTNAVPVLRKHGIPACFFISTGFMGNEKGFPHDVKRLGRKVATMSWAEIEQLVKMGFDIGAHTVNHVRLSTCDDEVLSKEIRGSKEVLEERLSVDVKYFAYPFGKRSDLSVKAKRAIEDAGFECIVSAYGGLNRPSDDPFHLKRQNLPKDPSLMLFRALVEGWKVNSF